MAQALDEANTQRKELEQTIEKEAQAEIDAYFDPTQTFGVAVGNAGWHQGTVGIVASRLCSRYHRPAIVIGFDKHGNGRGSCRSIDQLDILAALNQCREHLVTFGGHTMAAGVSIRIEQLEAFAGSFNRVCKQMLEGRDLRPTQRVDAWIQFGDTDWALLHSMDALRPFGLGNPTPNWGVRGVTLAGPARQVGKRGGHWKLSLAQGGSVHDAVAFNMGQYPIPQGRIDVVFQARPNTFRGGEAIELHVQDLRPSV